MKYTKEIREKCLYLTKSRKNTANDLFHDEINKALPIPSRIRQGDSTY